MVTPTERAIRYTDGVLEGHIPNCKWVKLACKRFKRDLARQGTKEFPYVYKPELGDRIVSFEERMPHVKGEWQKTNQRLVFEDWQCFTECNLFGWIREDDGYRRFTKSYEKIPRKNAKSTKLAARGLYLFCADGESGAEVYSGATTEKQAFEVYRPAWIMANKLSSLREHFGIEQSGNAKNPGSMYTLRDMSRFETIIGTPGDGASPHGALIDEYHEHETDHMVETMQTGMGARRQPMLSIITTAGSNLNGPCYEMEQDMQKILEGNLIDESQFACMWGLDKDDDWQDPLNLIKANPNYNISVFEAHLLAMLAEAKRSARKQNAFRTKHLNEWVGAKTAWMDMVAWARQGRKMEMDDFADCPAQVAVDLNSQKDVAAVDITFKKNENYFSFKKYFVPEKSVEDNKKYLEYVLSGHLETTDGSMIDQERIEEYVEELCTKYNVLSAAFDEWQADYMMTRLASTRINVIKFPFRVRMISEPMKKLEALILDGRYWHDNNPMTTWMYGNVTAKEDIRGNIFPNKAQPNSQFCKIDGVVVSIMSIGRWYADEDDKPQHQLFFV